MKSGQGNCSVVPCSGCPRMYPSLRAYEKAEDGVHYCEERFLEVARRFGVLGMPARHVSLEEAFKAHASQVRAESTIGA